MNVRAIDLTIQVRLAEDIIIRFLRAETKKAGFRRYVLGLSGGLDSALLAALVVAALGKAAILPYFLPFRSSSPASEKDAERVCQQLGLTLRRIEITAQVEAYFEQVGEADALRRGNKMARERMAILFDQAMAHQALVVGASNKSELLLGYGTWFGDLAASSFPIGDLYKTQVRQMGRDLQLPAEVLEKAPTADLWTDQTDEGELGFTYELADQILFLFVEERLAEAEIVRAGFPPATVGAITNRIRQSQFKRRLPPVCKLSSRTVGWDFRYLRDWKG
ncbi:MAG: NAD+ synthase [Coprothermobacterota bacterium]|nr:NAD+ synthase [Coprothermobacterota bacterium]